MALRAKQQAFINEYLIDFNATQAAIRAGYSKKTAGNTGWENLKKPEIAEAIEKRISEQCMTADEVLMRLAEQARADIGEFISDEGEIDIEAMKAAGATRLLRKVRHTTRGGVSKDGAEWEVQTVEVDLHNAQTALELIGKYHRLFDGPSGAEDDPIHVKHIHDLTDEQLAAIAAGGGE